MILFGCDGRWIVCDTKGRGREGLGGGPHGVGKQPRFFSLFEAKLNKKLIYREGKNKKIHAHRSLC